MREPTRLRWRKLLADSGTEWAQLTFTARAYASEILRRLDAENSIVAAPGKSVFDAICLAVGIATPERRTLRAVLVQLEAARWIELRSDRLVAYFPDLGARRPTSTGRAPDEHRTSTALTPHEHRSDVGLTPHEQTTSAQDDSNPRSYSNDAGREEKRREEQIREEKTRARDPSEVGPESSQADHPPLRRLLGGFRERWDRKTSASWRLNTNQLDRARQVADDFAADPDGLSRALDAFFESQDPFVAKTRWSFGLWLNDPKRYLDAPTAGGRLRPAARGADVEVQITDDLFVRKEASGA